MIQYRVNVPKAPRLGQLENLFGGGLTQDIAGAIVSAAEAPTRAIIRDERNRLAESLVGGLPFVALSGIAGVATWYLVPSESKGSKFAGYTISLSSLGIGGWLTYDRLTEAMPATSAPKAPPPPVVQQTAQAVVDAAAPKIKALVDEERARISEAAQSGLPFAAGGALALIGSLALIPDDSPMFKVMGLVSSVGLFTLGAYVALRKEQA